MYLKYKNYTYIHCFNFHGLPDCQAMSWWRIVPSMVSHLAQVDECLLLLLLVLVVVMVVLFP